MADQEITIGIKAEVDEVKAHLDELKEGFEKAKEAAKLFNEIVNSDVSNSLKQAAADTEAVGTAVEAAFNPMKLIAFFQAVAAATEKITQLISDIFIYTDAEKKAVDQIKEENKVLQDLANRTKEARRERQLLEAATDSDRDKLRLQFKLEDQGGSSKDLKAQLDALIERRRQLAIESQKTEKTDYYDPGTGQNMGQGVEQLTEGAVKAQEELKRTEGQVQILARKVDAAAAEEAAADAQIRKDRAREAQEAERQRQQALMQSFQQQLDSLKMNHQVSHAEEQAFWIAKLAQVRQGTALYNQIYHQIAQGQQAVLAERARLEAAFAKASEQVSQDIAKQHQKETEEALRNAAERNKRMIADLRASMEEKMQMVADHDRAEVQMEEQTVEQNLELGRISKQQEIAQLAEFKKEELQIEISHLRNKEQLYQNDAKEIAKIERDIAKLQAQQAQIGARAVTDSIKAQKQEFDKMFSSVNNSLSGLIHDLTSGTESVSQAFGKMFQGIVSQLINFVEQWIEKKLEMWLMEQLFAKKKSAQNAGQATSNTAVAATEALASAPWPINIAAAEETEAMGLGFAAETIVPFTSAGGDWRVDSDRLNFVHKNETILPAGIAGKLREMVEGGGGGGISVIVNHSVNAVDAGSFQTHIRKHGNMIGNEVARVLKKRGFAVR
jgi:hypothetical protein